MARNREEALWKDGLETDTSSYVKEVPFPFIMTCLNIGASFDAPEGYYHQVHVEDFHMAYDEGDNNNGESCSQILMLTIAIAISH